MKTAYDRYDAMVRAIPPYIKAEGDLEFAISNRIYDLMTQKGMSKAEFARAVGKRPCEITKWLSGQHNFTLFHPCYAVLILRPTNNNGRIILPNQ